MIDPKKIWNSPQLPTLPSVAVRLLDLSKDPETDIREVTGALKSDPALNARILKAANSSFFAVRTQVVSIERAVPLLGTTVVTSLALSFSLSEAAMTSGPMAEHYRQYWRQSVVQAAAAESLAEFSSPSLGCEYFLAGLLADFGRLAMLKAIPREYASVLEMVHIEQRDLCEAEQMMLGLDHVEVGVRLMQEYKLPAPLVDAVRLHHAAPDVLFEELKCSGSELRRAVAVASAVGEYFCLPSKIAGLQRLRLLAGEFYGLAGRELDSLLSRVKSRMEAVGELFAVDAAELATPGDLMAQANEQLAELAMREHVATTHALARSEAAERERRQLEHRARRLEQAALIDPLTGVQNRRSFDDALRREIERCGRTAEPVAVIFADLDRFKLLNDCHGHAFGDRVLQQTARVLSEVLRPSDVLARYGGEEFVILAAQPTEKGLRKVAERIRTRVEQERLTLDGQSILVTISVGAAFAIPRRTDPELATRLLATADEAMYESKRNGRNQVHVRLLCSELERRLVQLSLQRRFSRWLVRRGVLDVGAVGRALLQYRPSSLPIGALAQQQGWLDSAAVEQVLHAQRQTDERFGLLAIRLGLLEERQVAQLLAVQQEDPTQLSAVLARLGFVDPRQGAELAGIYLAEQLLMPSSTAAAD